MYETVLQHLLCPLDQLDKELKREIDIQKNVIRLVTNQGDKLMKLCFIENNNYAIIYVRNFDGISIVQLNIYNLIGPIIGPLLKFDRRGNLVPIYPDTFIKECPLLYQVISGQFDIIRLGCDPLNVKNGELCLNIILGPATEYDSLRKIVAMLAHILPFVYKIAHEVLHASGVPEKTACAEARKYMRAFNKYQND